MTSYVNKGTIVPFLVLSEDSQRLVRASANLQKITGSHFPPRRIFLVARWSPPVTLPYTNNRLRRFSEHRGNYNSLEWHIPLKRFKREKMSARNMQC